MDLEEPAGGGISVAGLGSRQESPGCHCFGTWSGRTHRPLRTDWRASLPTLALRCLASICADMGSRTDVRGHTPSYEALLDDIPGFLQAGQGSLSEGTDLSLRSQPGRQPRPQLRLATQSGAARRNCHRALAPRRLANRRRQRSRLPAPLIASHPAITQEWGLETAALTHDTEIVEAYDVDPLVHGRISVRLYVTAAEAGEWALQHAASFPLPLLLMHGTADRVTSAEASREFAARAGTKATWRAWERLVS